MNAMTFYILKQLNLPVVIDINIQSMIYDHVYANNYDSGFEGTRYLANKGHKHIALSATLNTLIALMNVIRI